MLDIKLQPHPLFSESTESNGLCRRCRIEVNIGDLLRLSTAATSHLRSFASNPHTCQTETSKRVLPLLLTARSTSTSVDLLQASVVKHFLTGRFLALFRLGCSHTQTNQVLPLLVIATPLFFSFDESTFLLVTGSALRIYSKPALGIRN